MNSQSTWKRKGNIFGFIHSGTRIKKYISFTFPKRRICYNIYAYTAKHVSRVDGA